jgi:hypothetical protein
LRDRQPAYLGGLETRTPETGLILKTGPLTSQSPTGEPIMGSTTDKVKKGIDQAAGTLKPATDKAAGTIKDTAHQAGKTMQAAGQRVKDAAE